MNQLKHCLMRNFGGKVDVGKTVELFLKKVKDDLSKIITAASDVEVNTYMYAFTIALVIKFFANWYPIYVWQRKH